jgi:hypothetical protein
MLRRLRPFALILAVALAFAPLLGEHVWLPSPKEAEAQFQSLVQAKTLLNAVSAAGGSATLDTSGNPIVGVQITGTFVATLVPQGSLDGTNWSTATCYALGSSSAKASFTSPDTGTIVRCNMVGVPLFRVNVSSFTTSGLPSGVTSTSVTVKAFATQSYFPLGTNVP